MEAHACNLGTWETEAGLGVKDHLQLRYFFSSWKTGLTSEYTSLYVSVCCVCRPGKDVGSPGAAVAGCVCAAAGHG